MTAQGALLALAVPLALGLAGLSGWLLWRARSAEGATERRQMLMAAVAGAASEIAAAREDPVASVSTALERAEVTDASVLVLDEASGSWLPWTHSGQRQVPAAGPLAQAAQRAWDRGEAVAQAGGDGARSAIGCQIPLPGGASAVLVALGRRATVSEAERTVVEACAGLLGASGLPVQRRLPEREAHDGHARGPVDSLTGLVDASSLLGPLQERCRDPRTPVAIVLVAVDGLEGVSERLGGRSGDEVLRIAARRLQRCVRPDDILARIDSTIFGILLADGTDPEGSVVVGKRAREALASPVAVTAGSVHVAVRVGLVWDASEDADPARLLPEARSALSRSGGEVITTIRLGDAPSAERDRAR